MRRCQAEEAWRVFAQSVNTPLHIFRLGGIYGPFRNALASVRAGTARRIYKEGQVFSRIHVADIATILYASMTQLLDKDASAAHIYNVCDHLPAPPQDVVAYAAQLLGVAPPPLLAFADADLSDMARSFYSENKYVSAQKLEQALGVHLRYPDYRAGLDALYKDGAF